MYLPVSELQMYRGQLTCQYCIMDLRDEERRLEERRGIKEQEKKKEEELLEEVREGEVCERCGRLLTTVYYVHGKKLCASCFDHEKEEWKGTGPERPPLSPYRIKTQKSFLSNLVVAIEKRIGDLLALIGITKLEEKKRKQSVFEKYHGVELTKKEENDFASITPLEEKELKKAKRPKKQKVRKMQLGFRKFKKFK
jgi:hypothetical protein